MTRETKAGLVVSCSFLCLVGLVFYYKLNGPGNSSADARAEDASVEAPDAPVPITENGTPGGDNQTVTPATDVQPGSSSGNESTNVVSAPAGTEKSTLRDTSSLGQGNQGNDSSHHDNAIENTARSTYEIPGEKDGGKKNATSSDSSAVDSSRESSSKEKNSNDLGNGTDLQPIQENKEHEDISKASLSLILEEQTKLAVKHAAAAGGDTDKSQGSSAKQPPGTFNQPASDKPIPPAQNDALGKTGNAEQDLEPPPIPSKYKHTLPDELPKETAKPVPLAPQAPGKFGRDAGVKKPVSAPAEAAGIKLHVPETVPGTSSTRSGGQIQGLTPGVMPSPVLTSPPAGDTAPEPRIQLGRPAPVPSPAKQLVQGPREGQNASAGFPLPAAPLASSTNPPPEKPPLVPRVESYDEETYICQPRDTFAGISSHYYYTDKYALALLQFNRHHPRAAVGISQDPPVLQAGQPVYIPPLRILEKQYLSAPADPSLITQVGAPSPALTDPRNPASLVPPVTIPPGKSWSTPSGERTYPVPDQGEMFLEIARKTLGSPDRWAEIYRLNPQYDPKYRVPAGTNLRLPADARVTVPEKKPMPITPEPKAEGGTPDQPH
jgi:hypothetical protein